VINLLVAAICRRRCCGFPPRYACAGIHAVAPLATAENAHDTVGIVRRGLRSGINEVENRCTGTDADRKRHHRNTRKTTIATQDTATMPKVLPYRLDHMITRHFHASLVQNSMLR
jgi:hypothetical protein